jgi:DNA-binding transcriptional MerR regulator
MMERAYGLQTLCTQAGVTPRTVRYYIQHGLLPAPDPQGPATRYSRGHLDRLRLIRNLQREHQPLAEIRSRLQSLKDEDIHRLIARPAASKRPASAAEYVRAVLGPASPLPARAGKGAPSTHIRSQWERIPLAADVELHVRRPLTRDTNRRVDKLVDLARRLLEGDSRAGSSSPSKEL